MSTRRATLESLQLWPKELAWLVAEYSSPYDQDERLQYLLHGPNGQKIIIPGDTYHAVSIHWTDILGYRQIFLRRGGKQSRNIMMNSISHMTQCLPRYDDPWFKGCESGFMDFFGGSTFTQIRSDDYMQFLSRLAEMLAEIE